MFLQTLKNKFSIMFVQHKSAIMYKTVFVLNAEHLYGDSVTKLSYTLIDSFHSIIAIVQA